MRLIRATSECPDCGKKFHQIDGTEERALQIVRDALAEHAENEHTIGCSDECPEDCMADHWGEL